MKLTDLDTGEEYEYGYVFAFAPAHPVNQEDYAEAQREWLNRWQPWPGDLPQ
jgi:hypothetical protein